MARSIGMLEMSANREPRPHRGTCGLGRICWWVGLGLLLVNDHVFKGSGFLPGVLIGKLSDFAGLLIAPTVCAAAFRIRSRRGLLACHVAVGGAFALLKCSPPIASYWDTFLRELGISASTCPDPTDLLALGSVWWSWKLFGVPARPPQPREGASHLGALDRFAAVLGALACVASLDAAAPPLAPAGKEDTILGDAFIHIDESITSGYVGIEPFTGGLDCRKALADPGAFLDAEGFNAAEAVEWIVRSRFNVALRAAQPSDPQPDCYLSRVDLFATNPETTREVFIVAWASRELPVRTIPARTLLAETPRDGVIVARLVDDELTFEARRALRIAQEK